KGVYLTLCSLTVQSLANFKLSRKQSNSGRSRVCFMTAFTIPYLYYKVCTLEGNTFAYGFAGGGWKEGISTQTAYVRSVFAF
ncbi:MAG: hypothetical protein IJT75_02740, partial [Bacteroidaceae bacterium]|nr:hypothetical protein [Bacteroidaceae bacterium]